MKTIRLNTFETNSSSVHAICICSNEEYQKFEDMKLFWSYEHLKTPEELYKEFCQFWAKDRDDLTEYAQRCLDIRFLGHVPSYDLFLKALTEPNEWHFVRESDRCKYKSDEAWIIANIQMELASKDIGNCHNYNYNGDWYYDTFEKDYKGIVAFGYYGHN